MWPDLGKTVGNLKALGWRRKMVEGMNVAVAHDRLERIEERLRRLEGG
nr:hypothetical protein [uncultured archaeon]UVT38866.1 hypothetical protein [uncultured bacterium]